VIHARRVHEQVLADPQRFGPAAADLIVRARRARDPEALIVALRAYAWAQRSLLAEVEAKRLLDEAHRIARRAGLPEALADVLMSRAVVNQELGRLTAAARDLDAAAGLAAADRQIELAFQRAVLAQNIGRLGDAAAIYRDLLSNPDSPLRTQVRAANNLALIEAQHGRYAEATRRLSWAAGFAAEDGPAAAAAVAQSLAWVTVQSGRLAEGLRCFTEAAQAYESASLPLGEHFVEYADALIDLRLIPEATAAARSAEEQFRAGKVPLMGAEAALRVAQLALLAGDAARAESAARDAAGSFGRQGRPSWRARAVLVEAEARLNAGTAGAADLRAVRRAAGTLEKLGMSATAVQAYLVAGRMAATLGRTRRAVDTLRHAARLARDTPVLVRLRGQVANALAARLRRSDGDVLAHCRRGLADLAHHRTALPSVELRALASGHGAELGQLGLEVVVRAGSPPRVLDWMERTRAAGLLTVQPPDLGEIKDDLDALRAVHAELDVLADQSDRDSATPAPLLAKQLAIENRIRRATWQRHAAGVGRERGRSRSLAEASTAEGRLDAGRTIDVPALRRLLDGRILVEYGTLGDRLVAVVLEPRRSRIVPLGSLAAVQDQVRALLFALRRLTQTRPAQTLTGARLSADLRISRLTELLLAPLCVAPDAELVVVPVGPLHGVPWSALHDGPLSLAPSATFWARTREAARNRPGADRRVVLVAGPNLPGASAEVAQLSTMYPQATVIAPPESTADAVAALLGGADLAHLACHGRLRADNPMFSSLILSDGPLTVQELETRGVAPHRMVLASCKSGADVSFAGDEVLGFVSALLARGTAGVVASIAAIPDVQAVDLMRALHVHLVRGHTLAHALHGARASLDRTEPGAYVNWSTFSAHGGA
jgi:CHAT domain-containing protein/tetratricopeptide (TPR) repeat protein